MAITSSPIETAAGVETALTQDIDGAVLAHFPVRSQEQLHQKIILGWLSVRLQNPVDFKPVEAAASADTQFWHWRDLFASTLRNPQFSAADLQRFAPHSTCTNAALMIPLPPMSLGGGSATGALQSALHVPGNGRGADQSGALDRPPAHPRRRHAVAAPQDVLAGGEYRLRLRFAAGNPVLFKSNELSRGSFAAVSVLTMLATGAQLQAAPVTVNGASLEAPANCQPAGNALSAVDGQQLELWVNRRPRASQQRRAETLVQRMVWLQSTHDAAVKNIMRNLQ